MKHAREDYDGIQPWPQQRPHICRVDGEVGTLPDGVTPENLGLPVEPVIPEDEPVALIRGQDPIGWRAVLAYCEIADAEGVQPDLVEALRIHAGKMREWCEQVGHGLPDAPDDVLRLDG